MPLFWNSIFLKIEFLETFFSFNFQFAITPLSKNRVLNWNLIFRNFEFQNGGISLNSFRYEAFCWKVLAKGANAHFLLQMSLKKRKKFLTKTNRSFFNKKKKSNTRIMILVFNYYYYLFFISFPLSNGLLFLNSSREF